MIYAAGACACGIVAYAPVAVAEMTRFDDWLNRGCNGEMAWLGRNAALSSDPAGLLPGINTIICAAFPYAPDKAADRHPLFADYARGADYHKALRKRLKPICRELEGREPGSKTRICIDSAPVRERYWAVAAGLGHVGLNGLLIVPGVGSKVFLAEILWTAAPDDSEQLPTEAQIAQRQTRTCLQCGACVRACPGGALDGHGGLDARKCLSYLSIEYHGDLQRTLSGRIYGCDVCQDVCPENKTAQTPLPEFRLRDKLKELDKAGIAGLSEEAYDELTIGSPIRRVSLDQLKRNAEHSED